MIESLFVCLFVGLWRSWSRLKPFVYWPHAQTQSERSALSCWGSTARVLRNHNLTNTQSSQGALWVRAAVTVKEGHLPFSRSDVTGSDIVAVGWREGGGLKYPDPPLCLQTVVVAELHNNTEMQQFVWLMFLKPEYQIHHVYMCLSVAAVRTQLYRTLWHFEKGAK